MSLLAAAREPSTHYHPRRGVAFVRGADATMGTEVKRARNGPLNCFLRARYLRVVVDGVGGEELDVRRSFLGGVVQPRAWSEKCEKRKHHSVLLRTNDVLHPSFVLRRRQTLSYLGGHRSCEHVFIGFRRLGVPITKLMHHGGHQIVSNLTLFVLVYALTIFLFF